MFDTTDQFQISNKTVFRFRIKQPSLDQGALRYQTKPGTTWFKGREEAVVALKCSPGELAWESWEAEGEVTSG